MPIYLEKWIEDIVRSVLGCGTVTRAEVERYQLLRLRQTLEYVCNRSPFYREAFGRAGIDPRAVRSIGDLSRIPFTEPAQLAQTPYRFLCISQADVARPCTFITSGTTGPQKKVFWSRGDLERIIEFMAAGIATVAGAGDVVQVMLSGGSPYSQADLLSRGVARIGAKAVLARPELDADEQLRIIRDSGSTVLFGYAADLFRKSKELHAREELNGTGVRAVFLAGAYVPDAMRRQLQEIWGCPVHTHYGLTEMGLGVAVECGARRGYHFNEAGLLLEVVDPLTGKPVEPGEEGELVFTTLTREAMPLIRYRTHDLSRLIPQACPCGASNLLRFDSVRKRVESVVTLKGGEQIDPSVFDDALFEVPEVIDYRARLTRESGKDRLQFEVELLSREPEVLQAIRRKLYAIPALAQGLASGSMAAEIGPAAPGSLGRAGKRMLIAC